MEQVEDEPQIFICPIQNDYEALIEDEPQIQLTAKCLNCNNSKVCKEKHWDGCVYEPKDEKTCETCRHWKYIAHEWQCEACKCQGYEPKDEPQTDDLQDWKDRMWAEAIVTEPQTCSVNGRPYDCGNCEYFKCTADEPQTEVVMPKKCKGCDSASKIIEAYAKGFEDGAEAVKKMPQTEYERASEQREHDILYEPTYDLDNGSM